jgi:hypothetical protein
MVEDKGTKKKQGEKMVTHDVFISYSTKDKLVANALCTTLENRKIRCWIASRDILPSDDFSAAIIKAINKSRIFVLVFSKDSNDSHFCRNEVNAAVSRGIPIIPFRIEDVKLSDTMELLIGLKEWLDALTPPLEKHLEKLADTIQILLANEEEHLLATSPQKEETETVTKTIPHPSILKTKPKAKRMRIIAASAFITIIILSMFFLSGVPFESNKAKTTPTYLDFTPNGIANVELSNGNKFLVPSNGFVFVDYNKLIQGLPNGDEVIFFENMNSFSVENSSILVAMKNGSTRNLTNYIFSSSHLYDYYTYTFLAPTNEGDSNWAPSEIKTVTFDHTGDWQKTIPMAIVTTVSGQTFTAPSQTLIFDEVTSSLGPSHSWNMGLKIESGNFIPFNTMKRLEVNANSTEDNVMVRITTTNGDDFETIVKGDTYFYSYIYGINKAGVFKLVFYNELKSIDFDWNP